MGISITIASGKGGTGKTFLAANLGIALASFGRDVIILDADIEMANLELHFGLEGMKTTLHHVLMGKAKVKDAIYSTAGGVKIVPAGVSLYKLRKANLASLKDILDELSQKTDILLVDVPPGISTGVVATLAAGKQMMLVVTPTFTVMPGAFKTKQVAKNLGVRILGAVVNRATSDEDDLTVKEVEGILEEKVVAVIPEDPEVKKALSAGTPLILHQPKAPASLAIKKLAADLIGVEYEIPKSQIKGLLKRLMKG